MIERWRDHAICSLVNPIIHAFLALTLVKCTLTVPHIYMNASKIASPTIQFHLLFVFLFVCVFGCDLKLSNRLWEDVLLVVIKHMLRKDRGQLKKMQRFLRMLLVMVLVIGRWFLRKQVVKIFRLVKVGHSVFFYFKLACNV